MKIIRKARYKTKFVLSTLLTGVMREWNEQYWTMLTSFRTFRRPKFGYTRNRK